MRWWFKFLICISVLAITPGGSGVAMAVTTAAAVSVIDIDAITVQNPSGHASAAQTDDWSIANGRIVWHPMMFTPGSSLGAAASDLGLDASAMSGDDGAVFVLAHPQLSGPQPPSGVLADLPSSSSR